MRFFQNMIYSLKAIINIVRGDYIHNSIGAFHVLRFWHVQKVHAGLLAVDHPWCTGINPETGAAIWPENIVFKTKRKDEEGASDEIILEKVGRFLTGMVKKSTATPEIPHGPNRRMPHVVNYLHGSVHYNGMWLLFNSFDEAKYFFSDAAFRKEFKRLVKKEKREVTLVFRSRQYDPVEFAYFSGFIMAHFPWFANVNGPGKKVMWGNASPYPVMNIINGSWVADVNKLRQQRADFVRKPLEVTQYFQGDYGQVPVPYYFVERFIAYFENEWVRRRGFNGGLFFIDRKKIEPKAYEKYLKDKSTFASKQLIIPNPLRKS